MMHVTMTLRFGLFMYILRISVGISLVQEILLFERTTKHETFDVDNRTWCLQDIVGKVRSPIQVAAICAQMEQCVAISVENNTALVLMTCNVTQGKTILTDWKSTLPLMYKIRCLNGGLLLGSKCNCKDGWVGLFCERRPRDCVELSIYGYYKTDTFIIQNVNEFSLKCRFEEGIAKSMVMQYRGDYPANLSFQAFENGWDRGVGDVFTGLKNLYNIVKVYRNNAVLLIQIQDEDDYLLWKYYNFTLTNFQSFYSYNYTSSQKFGGQKSERMKALKDCLEVSKGFPFSTWDQDNDADENVNCALKHGAGWWFGNCSADPVCSPLGLSPHEITPAQENVVAVVPGLNLSAFRDSSPKWFVFMVVSPHI